MNNMVKKMKLPSIFKNPKMSWKWFALKHLKAKSDIAKSKNNNPIPLSDNAKFITDSAKIGLSNSSQDSEELMMEMAATALRSNRLFFEPGNTNSILDVAMNNFPFEDCVAFAIETEDPYVEFRVSMEEIVKAYEIRDSEHLEELLAWYLRMNKRKNHGFIVGAFIDMFTSITSCSSSCFISG